MAVVAVAVSCCWLWWLGDELLLAVAVMVVAVLVTLYRI